MLSLVTSRRRIWAALTAGGLAAALAVAGLTGAAQARQHSSTTKPVLTVGLSAAPSSLDPAKDGNGLQSVLRSLTNEPLFHMTSGFKVGAGLATSWHYVGAGNTEFEFKIRSGARFSDGTALTAAAVKAWLLYFVKANGPFASALPIKSIRTIGRHELLLKLSTPDPILPLELSEYDNAGFVSNVKHASELSSRTDGVGPYVLDSAESQIGSQYTLVPNKNYFDQAAIHFSKVVFKIISSSTSMLEALQAGQLDLGDVDPTVVKALTNHAYKIDRTPGGVADIVILDRNGTLVPALGSVQVRQALNYAINRTAIAKGLAGKDGTATSQLSTDYSAASLNDYYPYNPGKAKALLAAAGYPNGFTITLVDPGEEIGNDGDPVAQAVAKYWSAIGVQTKITAAASNSQFLEGMVSKQYAAGEWTPAASPTLLMYAELLSPQGSFNPFQVDDPAIDKAFEMALVSQGKQQAAAFREVNDLATESAVTVPVFAFSDDWAVSTHLHGFNQSLFQPLASEWTWKS